jgi:hypothetical protein
MGIKPEELDCGTVDSEQLPAYSTRKFLIRINDEILISNFCERIRDIFKTPDLSKTAEYVRKLVLHDGKKILNLNRSTKQKLLTAAKYTYFLEKYFFDLLDFFFSKVKDKISSYRPPGTASQKPVKISALQMFFCFEQLEGIERDRIFRLNFLDSYWRAYFHLKAELQLEETEEKYDRLFEDYKDLSAAMIPLFLKERKDPAKTAEAHEDSSDKSKLDKMADYVIEYLVREQDRDKRSQAGLARFSRIPQYEWSRQLGKPKLKRLIDERIESSIRDAALLNEAREDIKNRLVKIGRKEESLDEILDDKPWKQPGRTDEKFAEAQKRMVRENLEGMNRKELEQEYRDTYPDRSDNLDDVSDKQLMELILVRS